MKETKQKVQNLRQSHQAREALFFLFFGGDSGVLSPSAPLSSEADLEPELVSSSSFPNPEPASSASFSDSERQLTASSESLISVSSPLKTSSELLRLQASLLLLRPRGSSQSCAEACLSLLLPLEEVPLVLLPSLVPFMQMRA